MTWAKEIQFLISINTSVEMYFFLNIYIIVPESVLWHSRVFIWNTIFHYISEFLKNIDFLTTANTPPATLEYRGSS